MFVLLFKRMLICRSCRQNTECERIASIQGLKVENGCDYFHHHLTLASDLKISTTASEVRNFFAVSFDLPTINPNVDNVSVISWHQELLKNRSFRVVSLDWCHHSDWTVVFILCTDKTCVEVLANNKASNLVSQTTNCCTALAKSVEMQSTVWLTSVAI